MKTSVYLDPDDKRRLTALARSSGVSEAELIRRGVDSCCDKQRDRVPTSVSR